MITRFPVVPAGIPATGYLNQLVAMLSRTFSTVVSKDEETPRIVLRSPAGKLFDLTVDDTGTLVTTPTEKLRA